QQRLQGLGQNGVERGECSAQLLLRARRQPIAGVQREQRQGVRSARLQLGRQDARVGQGVAVDLCGQRVRQRSASGGVVGGLQLVAALVDVERSAGCRLR